MALVRILVDGYSLLHVWRDLAPGKPRFSEAAREELIEALTHYQDAMGTPVSIIFDGRGVGRPKSANPAKGGVEVLYSTDGRTADDLIERAAHRLSEYGEVLVVTNDRAERDTVQFVGGSVCSCRNFIGMVESSMDDLKSRVDRHNRRQRDGFRSR